MSDTAVTKDITLGGTTFQLTRIGAREGSWIVGQFLKRGLLTQLEGRDKQPDEKDLGLAFAISFSNFPEEVFASIQFKCLNSCRCYETVGDSVVAKPLLMADGRWAITEPDLLAVTALIVASLVFNLSSFFAPGALKTLLQIFPDLSRLNSTT